MSQALIQHVAKSSVARQVPQLKAGYVVRVHQRIQEGGKERIQIFEGLVIGMKGANPENKMFTVRKIVDSVGVEKTFPLFSPVIAKIEVLRAGRVRRAKLYFMRDLAGKGARLKDGLLGDVATVGDAPVVVEEPVVEEEEVTEEVVAEETPEAPAEEVAVAEAPVADAEAEEQQ